jgi:hypothetical protein
LRAVAKDMGKIFDGTPRLGRPVQVFRGIPGRPSDYGFKPGYTVTDSGYGSTSTLRSVAEGVGSPFSDKFILEMTVHPEVRAIWLNRAGLPETGFWEHEMEALLQAGCRYVVQSVKGNRVKVVVLPPK